MSQSEIRTLSMHEALLLRVIRDQACTLEKAILEGSMNSREAGSEEVRISYQTGGKFNSGIITIADDGVGISTEEELVMHFEKFGTPHEDSECKTWARFRMGRGQLFAYGKNTWRTATFEMIIDIKHKGSQYELRRGLPHVKGTTIQVELYDDPFSVYGSIDALSDKIKHQIEYMPGRILFNGTQLNTPADNIPESRWTEVDENAYYLFGVGSKLTVYNLGAYVMDLSAADVGVTGVVISRKQLDVNFARGGVHDRCQVYQSIRKVIKKHKPVRKRREVEYLTDWEKTNLVTDFRDGAADLDVPRLMVLKVFRTSSTRSLSLNDIKAIKSHWTFAPMGDGAADRLMQAGTCVCVDKSILKSLNYVGEERNFWSWLAKRQPLSISGKFSHLAKWYQPFGEATKGMNRSSRILAKDVWTKKEQQVIRMLDRYSGYWRGRTFCIGQSDIYAAWTDGSTYIALERRWLGGLRVDGSRGVRQLLTMICHELAHDDKTDCTHIHGEEFYHHYHDITMADGWCPLDLCATLAYDFKRIKIDDHHEKQQQKEQKATEKIKAKLGITETPTTVEKVAAKIKLPRREVKNVRRRGVGRLPAGAMGDE